MGATAQIWGPAVGARGGGGMILEIRAVAVPVAYITLLEIQEKGPLDWVAFDSEEPVSTVGFLRSVAVPDREAVRFGGAVRFEVRFLVLRILLFGSGRKLPDQADFGHEKVLLLQVVGD